MSSRGDILDHIERKLDHATATGSPVQLSRNDAERVIAEIRTLRRQRAQLGKLELTRDRSDER